MGIQLSVGKKEDKRHRNRHMQYPPYPGIAPGYGTNPPWPGAPYATMPVIPPGYGQGFVPAALPWPASQQTHKRKRKHATGRRRHHRSATDPSMNLPAGFVPNGFMRNEGSRIPMPQPVTAPAMNRAPSQGQPPPLFTPGPNNTQHLTSFPSPQIPIANAPSQGGRVGGSSNGHGPGRRAPTPFIPRRTQVDDDDDDDDDGEDSDDGPVIPEVPHSQRGHRQAAPMPEPIPLLPTYTRPLRPPNRLPEPPKIFDRTPFKRLVDLPTSVAPFVNTTTTAIEMINPDAGIAGIGANGAQKKKSRLFRGLSFRGSRRADSTSRPGNGTLVPVARVVPVVISNPAGGGALNSGTGTGAGTTTTTSTSQPPVRFSHNGPFSGFLISAPHPVTYQGKVYPTALHLYEARKYLDASPEAAEIFTQCGVSEIMSHSGRFRQTGKERPDWSVVFLQVMEEVIYLKMVQHEWLRRLLLDTGSAPLVFGEGTDSYWGEGPMGDGANELGKALVRIRDKLKANGYT
ncbi:hypothetical protein AX15_003745 [Amanita polypyramis BW_CC]|nr:hypothetical protein AX15_003745 [Amanita polypyramis BW_CC]